MEIIDVPSSSNKREQLGGKTMSDEAPFSESN